MQGMGLVGICSVCSVYGVRRACVEGGPFAGYSYWYGHGGICSVFGNLHRIDCNHNPPTKQGGPWCPSAESNSCAMFETQACISCDSGR